MTKYNELEKIAKKQLGISLDKAYSSAGDGKGTFRLQGILNAMERAYEAGRDAEREDAGSRSFNDLLALDLPGPYIHDD